MTDLLGPNPAACSHPKTSPWVYIVIPEEERDYAWACAMVLELVAVRPPIPSSIRLCDACADQRPSVVAAREQAAVSHRKQDARDARERLEFLKRVYTSSEEIYFCDSCDEEVEPVVVRYCTHCESTFDGSNGSACPDCNRPFTRRSADAGCPTCLEEETELEPRTLTAEEITEVLAAYPDLQTLSK